MEDLSFYNEFRRKIVHLSSLWMPLMMRICAPWKWELAAFFFFLALDSILLEHAYARNIPWARKIYDFFFGNMLRREPKETDWVISGGPPVLAAAFLSILFFPLPVAAGAMSVMLLGDTAAALVGKRWGRIRFSNGKSLEGSLAFTAAGMIGFFVFAYPGTSCLSLLLISCAVAAVGAITEFFQSAIRIDDNLLIPTAAGLSATLLNLL